MMMKKNWISTAQKLISAALALCIPAVALAGSLPVAAAGTEANTSIQCEYKKNPLGIDNEKPRFSWITESDGRALKQTAYRIIVSSTKEKLDAAQGDMWDSGTVRSDRSVNVVYEGSSLKARTTYYWKVHITANESMNLGWSEDGYFSMGMLSAADWGGAQWITRWSEKEWRDERNKRYAQLKEKYPTTKKLTDYVQQNPLWDIYTVTDPVSPSPQLRKNFRADKEIGEAKLYVSGLGYFEAYLNGEKVSDHLLDSGVMDYSSRVPYNTFDVTEMLNGTGENALGIWLGNGFYNQNTPDPWKLMYDTPYNDQPRALVQLAITYADGSKETVVSDASWKGADSAIIFDSAMFGEIRDGRLENIGWSNAGYNDGTWEPVHIASAPAGKLEAFKMEPIRTLGEIKPVEIKEISPGKYRYDFGQEFTGHVRLKTSGEAGTKVTMSWCEGLWDSGEQWHYTRGAGRYQQVIYLLAGTGEETYAPKFSYQAGRYVLLEGVENPTLETLTGVKVGSDLEHTAVLDTSSDLINQIDTAVKNTMDALIHSYPQDCPHREKSGWGDWATLAGESSVFTNYTPSLYEKWMDDYVSTFTDAVPAGGMIVPSLGKSGGAGDLCWSGAYIITPYLTYKQYGDKKIIEDNYAWMKKYMRYIYQVETGKSGIPGILDGGMGDWVAPDDVNEFNSPDLKNTTTYYWFCQIMMELADVMDDPSGKTEFQKSAQTVKTALNEKLYDAQEKDYQSLSRPSNKTRQFYYLMPLAFDMVPEADRLDILNRLIYNIQVTEDNHLNTGHIGSKHLMDVLPQLGYGDVAYDIAAQETYPGWGAWIEKGATTIPETWSGATSYIHSCFLSVGSYFYKYLAGIQQAEGSTAYSDIVIKPTADAALDRVNATYSSVKGDISSSWEKTALGFTQTATLPFNTTGTVYVAKNNLLDVVIHESGTEVFKDGQFIPGVEGISAAYDAGEYVAFEVGSGSYHFTVESQSGEQRDKNIMWKLDFAKANGDVIADAVQRQSPVEAHGNPSYTDSGDGKAAVLNGENQFFSIGGAKNNSTMHPASRISIGAFIKPVSNAGVQTIYSLGDENETEQLLRLNNGSLEFGLKTADGYQVLSADTGDIADGQWHYVAGVYDGKRQAIYLDGKELEYSTYTKSAIFTSQADTGYIGSKDGRSEFFKGELKDVVMLNRAIAGRELSGDFSPATPPDPAIKRPNGSYIVQSAAASSSINDANGPDKAIDQSLADENGWHSQQFSSAEAAEWLRFDLGVARKVSTMVIYPRLWNGSSTYFAEDFVLQYSEDGDEWHDISGQRYENYGKTGAGQEDFVFDAPVTAQHFRMFITKLGYSSAFKNYAASIGEVYLYEEPGEGTLSKTALSPARIDIVGADASSQRDASHAPGAVWDTNASAGNGWLSVASSTADTEEWIAVELAKKQFVSSVEIIPMRKDGKTVAFPSAFSVEYAVDGIGWTAVPGSFYHLSQAPEGKMTLEFAKNVPARFIRLRATELSASGEGKYAFGIAELRVLGPLWAKPKAVSASSNYGGSWDVGNLIDGVVTGEHIGWSSAGYTDPNHTESATIDLGENKTIDALMIMPREWAGACVCFPKDFSLFYSVDGENWTLIPGQQYTDYPKPKDFAGELFSFEAISARYIKFEAEKLSLDNGTTYMCQLREIMPFMPLAEKVALESAVVSGPDTIKQGQSIRYAVEVSPVNAYDRTFTWSILSGADLAEIDSDTGLLKAVGQGKVTIAAVSKANPEIRAEKTVTIAPPVAAEQIALTCNGAPAEKLRVNVMEQLQLDVDFTPADTSEREIQWSSSDSRVASVDQNGVVTALANGKTTIKAVSQNGKEAACVVEAVQNVRGVQVDYTADIVYVDDSIELAAEVFLSNPDGPKAKARWSSSDSSVASVDQNGRVTAHKKGTAVITATAGNSFTSTCTLQVLPYKATLQTTLAKSMQQNEGAGTTTPEGMRRADPSNRSGYMTYGPYLSSPAGQKTCVMFIRLVEAAKDPDAVIIDLDVAGNAQAVAKKAVTGRMLRKGQFVAISLPFTAEEDVGYEYRAYFHPNAGGTVEIAKYIVTDDGSAPTELTPPSSVQITRAGEPISQFMMKPNGTEVFRALVTPDHAYDKTVLWQSSDQTVLTVENGVVKALKAGKATLTATTTDGLCTGKCVITVKADTSQQTIDRTALQAMVESCSALFEKAYTPESWKPFAASLSHAKAVLTATKSTQAEIDAALSMLTTARSLLAEKVSVEVQQGWDDQSGKWYYYIDGKRCTGWQIIENTSYYFGTDGVMRTGWYKIGAKWYFSDRSGAMITGWKKLGKWYYFGTDGAMRTGWFQVNGKWYFADRSGAMITGWKKLGKWYYFGTNGAMRTGWYKAGTKWYFSDRSGRMLSDTAQSIDEKIYHFGKNGDCLNP